MHDKQNEESFGKSPILWIANAQAIDGETWHEFRKYLKWAVDIKDPQYVKSLADFQLTDIKSRSKMIIAGLMKKLGLASATILVLPLVSGRIVVIGRAETNWLVWHISEDLEMIGAMSEDVEFNLAWVLKLNSGDALSAYLKAIVDDSHDNLLSFASNPSLRSRLIHAFGCCNTIALAA